MGSADIMLIFVITFCTFMIYKLVQKLIRRIRGTESKNENKRLSNFRYRNYLELLDASYLVLFMATALNLPNLNMTTPEEAI